MRKTYYLIFALGVFAVAIVIFHFAPVYASTITEHPWLAAPREIIMGVIGPYLTNPGGIGTILGMAVTSIAAKVIADRFMKKKDEAISSAQGTIKKLQEDHVSQTTELANKVDELHRQVALADKQSALTEQMMLKQEVVHKEAMEAKQREIDALMREKQQLEQIAYDNAVEKIVVK